MNYILLPGRNRPEFFYLAMESLVKNPEIKDYGLLFALENDVDQRYFDIIQTFSDGLKLEIVKWPERYGLTKGILEGLKIAFSKSDEYVILLEDDVVVSRDFLRFLDYCYRRFYKPDGDIAAIGASTNRAIGIVSRVYKDRWYLPWGVLIPKYFFNKFLLEHCNDSYYQSSQKYADEYYPKELHGKDQWNLPWGVLKPGHSFNEIEQAGLILRIMLKNNLYQILPEVPRSLEIGFYGKHRHRKLDHYDEKTLEEKITYTRKLVKSSGNKQWNG